MKSKPIYVKFTRMNNILSIVPQTSISTNDSFSIILSASPVVKFILLLLLFFSVVSWAIIVFKYFSFKKSHLASRTFLNKFYDCENLDTMFTLASQFTMSPVASIFTASYHEMQKLSGGKKSAIKIDIENIKRSINKAQLSEISKYEEFIPFLATTASAAPFIGLFGTVWGIMNSFHAIGSSGSANLATVAPGISEALIATAIGLAAAIPAVIFYNYFHNRLKKMNAEMKTFQSDLLNIIKRNF